MGTVVIQSNDNVFADLQGRKPLVKVGGYPIPEQNFSWSFTSGVEPYTTSFWVPPAISSRLAELSNPVAIDIDFPTYTGAKQMEPSIVRLENLYLFHRAYADQAHVVWTISDSRWLLQGKKIYAVYNKTIQKNENQTAFPTTNSPADLRKFFETLSRGRYALWSVKGDGNPYSMKEVIENEFQKLDIKIWRGATNDLSYVVDNICYHGLDAARVIEEMLSLSRLGLGVNLRGELYLYSVNMYDNNVAIPLSALKEAKISNGILYAQDKSRGRPKKIRVLFEKKMETLLVATTETRKITDVASSAGGSTIYNTPLVPEMPAGVAWWTEDDVKERRVIACINVLPVPYPVSIDGLSRNPGEWIPINIYLQAFGLTESFLTAQAWFNGTFELRFRNHMRANFFKVATLTTEQLRQIQNISAVIHAHWRKTYIIDPFYTDQIKKWEPRMAAVINNYDRKTSPSPIFSNYFYLPMRRGPAAINDPTWKTDSYNWDVAISDPYLQNPSPAELGVINSQLGVFSVNFTQPLDPSVGMIGNFTLTTLPSPSPGQPSITLDKCYPTINHNLLTVISIVWERDPSASFDVGQIASTSDSVGTAANTGNAIKSQYFPIEILPDGKADFPDYEILSSLEHARFAFINRMISLPSGLAQFFGPGYNLLLSAVRKDRQTPFNLSFLQAIAKYEAGKIYNQFNDLYAGSLTIPGLRGDIILCGNLSLIQFSISPKGCSTTYAFLDIMPYPSLETGLPQKYIDYIRQNVARGDEISYLHTTL